MVAELDVVPLQRRMLDPKMPKVTNHGGLVALVPNNPQEP